MSGTPEINDITSDVEMDADGPDAVDTIVGVQARWSGFDALKAAVEDIASDEGWIMTVKRRDKSRMILACRSKVADDGGDCKYYLYSRWDKTRLHVVISVLNGDHTCTGIGQSKRLGVSYLKKLVLLIPPLIRVDKSTATRDIQKALLANGHEVTLQQVQKAKRKLLSSDDPPQQSAQSSPVSAKRYKSSGPLVHPDVRMKLTTRLLRLCPQELQAATQHPFLLHAAEGSLPGSTVVKWLAQDRLYAISYLTFIGQLISKLSVSSTADRQATLNWRITSCLIDCLTSIRQELDLFERVADQYGWMEDLGKATPSIHTQTYKNLFAGAAQPSASLLKGLVTLWATEKCYALSWGYARSNLPVLDEDNDDVMQTVFIPNWSSREFEQFVLTLGNLVDELAKPADAVQIQETEATWKQILWAEENFWPAVTELIE